jgi:hypothetical protein
LLFADILGMGQQERSWDSVPGAGCLRPGASDRSRGISDLGMAGLHIGAPARLQIGRRAAQPGGASTPLVRDPGELLSRTYSGSSASVDYRRQLELNGQDSDEDVLFQQEMWYPERGAGGFSNLRQVGGGENRDSPPVQLLEESEYPTASELATEQCRSRRRGSPENRFRAGREEAGAGGRAAAVRRRPTDCPCSRGTVPVRHCLPGDHRACHLPGVARACKSRDGTDMTRLLGVPAEPHRGNRSLRGAVGLDSPLHRSWD